MSVQSRSCAVAAPQAHTRIGARDVTATAPLANGTPPEKPSVTEIIPGTLGAEVPDEGEEMITLGVVLALIGWLLSISWLVTVGVVLLVVGAVLFLIGRSGTAVGGRRNWY